MRKEKQFLPDLKGGVSLRGVMIAYLKNEKAILEKGYPYKKWPWFKYFLFRAAYLNTNILYDNSTQDCTRFYLYLRGNYEI